VRAAVIVLAFLIASVPSFLVGVAVVGSGCDGICTDRIPLVFGISVALGLALAAIIAAATR
jgi:hypothetical protein